METNKGTSLKTLRQFRTVTGCALRVSLTSNSEAILALCKNRAKSSPLQPLLPWGREQVYMFAPQSVRQLTIKAGKNTEITHASPAVLLLLFSSHYLQSRFDKFQRARDSGACSSCETAGRNR